MLKMCQRWKTTRLKPVLEEISSLPGAPWDLIPCAPRAWAAGGSRHRRYREQAKPSPAGQFPWPAPGGKGVLLLAGQVLLKFTGSRLITTKHFIYFFFFFFHTEF